MTRACVIGWPIEHSRSPLIHGYWLRTLGLSGSYTKEAVRPEDLASFLDTLASSGFAGCNVTVPHKEAAFRLARHKDRAATAAGAANTLWLDAGDLHASNTDSYGFMAHLDRVAPQWRTHDRPVSILGAGGAARAIIYGFLEAGVERVNVFNRSLERAQALAHHFGPRVAALPWERRSGGSGAVSVIVNTTTLGMKGDGDPGVDFQFADPDTVVSDIVYVPLETAFLAAARQHGLATVDGLGMLLHQAVPGFEKWFGVRPEVTDELYGLIRADIEGS